MAWPATRRAVLVACTTIVTGCTGLPGQRTPTPTDNPAFGDISQMNDLQLSTPAFEAGGTIPDKYGKAYQNVNPPLSIHDIPDEADSLVLIMDDPDAPSGTFTHWLVWNIPPDIDMIPEGWAPPEQVVQGKNDFGNVGFGGPKPPSKHTYRFKLYALDTTLDLSSSASKQALGDTMDGYIEAQTQLTGTFAP